MLPGGMNFLMSGDVEGRRKAKPDSWGDNTAKPNYRLENVGISPRTSESQTGDGFRKRVQSGYTLYVDDHQASLILPDDEFVLNFPNFDPDDATGTKVVFSLDGHIHGGNWRNPLSGWSGGQEINLEYLRTEK